ncbi:MAG: hypothetical protein JW850_01070 [Thermoflexales bacterium]|nr:hypothetical protein [Thermoflexales bacterium]
MKANIESQIANRKSQIPWLALLTLALVAACPVWGPGLVNTRGGGDSPFLLWRVHQLAANLHAGVFPARWMPDAAYGLGYPFFNYYAALPYYLAGLLNLAGADILSAIKLTQTLGFVLAAGASYGWFRRSFRSQAAAWLGAAAYTFAPFHLVNVYVRGDSLSEFYAFVFYPLILWAVDRAVERPGARSVAGLGLAYGGLMLTHNLSAFIFSPFALLYAAFRLSFKFQVSSFKFRASSIIAGLALGVALSAWLWAPAMLEMRYVQTSTLEGGYFHYSGHFRAAKLVQPAPGFVYDTTSRLASPFAMGFVQAIVAMLGAIVNCQWLMVNCQLLMSRSSPRSPDVQSDPVSGLRSPTPSPQSLVASPFLLTGLLLSTLMITPLSRPLWDHLPLLPMVQFPWRFLSVQALFAAAASAFLVERLPRWRPGVALAAAAALGLAVMLPLHPDRLQIRASDVTVERLQLYELFTANIGTTITYEWLPRDVNPRLYTSELVAEPGAPPRAFAVEGELLSADETSHRPTARTWQLTAGTNARLVFPLLYWPGWSAAIDGVPAPVQPAHSSGRLALDVPPGSHTVVLRLDRTPLRLAAELVSLAALVVCVGLALAGFRLQVSRFISSRACRGTFHVLRFISSRACRGTFYASPLLLLISLFLFSSRSPASAETWTMDFIQMPYLHSGQVEFEAAAGGERNTLVSCQIDQDHPSPGQSIHLTLDWMVAGSPLTATVSLVSPSEHLPGMHVPFSLGQSAAYLASTGAASSSHSLLVPPDLPAGVYLLQLRLLGAGGERFARTGTGLQRGPLYLRPIYVQGGRAVNDDAVLATFGERIRLHAVRSEQVTPTQLSVELDWSASRPVAANYGIAVRLYNGRGERWAAIDTQPGYGFLPTVTWRPGGKLTDRLVLSLPEGLPPRGDYELEIILYDLADNLAGIGRYIQTGVSLTQYARRPTDSPALAKVGPHLALAALDLPASHPQGVPVLSFDAGWLVVAAPVGDALARWSLVDGIGSAVATCTSELLASTWPAGAYVLDAVHMPVPASLLPGRYSLQVALLDAQTGGEIGQSVLDRAVELRGRARRFDLPALDHQGGVTLGGQLRWEGYSLAREQSTLRLTLAWRALEAMGRDYTVFVHLVDAQGAIVAQHDAMPLENAYPTSWWAAGEVVVDTVTLALEAVPPGDYHLVLGVYDGATGARLEARDALGQRLPDDRIVLPGDIRLP